MLSTVSRKRTRETETPITERDPSTQATQTAQTPSVDDRVRREIERVEQRYQGAYHWKPEYEPPAASPPSPKPTRSDTHRSDTHRSHSHHSQTHHSQASPTHRSTEASRRSDTIEHHDGVRATEARSVPMVEASDRRPATLDQTMLDVPADSLLGGDISFKYDKIAHQFTVMRGGGGVSEAKEIGSFDGKEVVKLMLDRSLKHETNVSPLAAHLIENLIGDTDPRSSLAFRFKSLEESPFMRDVESLVRLNNRLHHFEEKELPPLLTKISAPEQRERVSRVVRHFIYHLLQHTLRVINRLGEQIRTDPSKTELKRCLSHYATGVVYRISQFTRSEVAHYGSEVKQLNENYRLVLDSRKQIGEKIDRLAADLGELRDREEMRIKLSGGGVQSHPGGVPSKSLTPPTPEAVEPVSSENRFGEVNSLLSLDDGRVEAGSDEWIADSSACYFGEARSSEY